MSHAEIWDDSALVDSWNEALQEYQHYHSLHVRGEMVEAVLQSHDLSASADTNAKRNATGDTKEGPTNGMNVDDEEAEVGNRGLHGSASERDEDKLSPVDQTPISRPSNGAAAGAPLLPQHLIGSVQDDGLKNLLMSWYYAGYYTGLYEGQQQARQGMVQINGSEK